MRALAFVLLVACAPQDPVRLILLGDTGTADQAQRDVADDVARTCGQLGCDAVLLLGDNFYPNGVSSADDSLWESAFNLPYSAVSLPFWVVLGNHDYGGLGLGFDKERAAVQVKNDGGKWSMPKRFYSRSVRQVDLFALDTTAILFGDDADQRAAVKAWLAKSTARWRVVFGHHPYLSSGVHGDAGSFDGFTRSEYAGETWQKFFADELCGKIDLYVSGHDHDLEWLPAPEKCGKSELVVSGGGGAEPREIFDRHDSRYKASVNGFFWLELASDKATGRVVEKGGEVTDVHAWRK